MPELNALKEFRSDVPPAGPAVVARARATMYRKVGARSRGHALRLRWVLVGAAASATAATVVAAAALPGLSGRTGSSGSRGTVPSAVSPSASATSGPSASAIAVMNESALDSMVTATGAEYTAGARYEAEYQFLLHTTVQRCLVNAGHSWPAPGEATDLADVADRMGANGQFPDLARLARVGRRSVTMAGPVPTVSRTLEAAPLAAVRACQAEAGKFFAPIIQVDSAMTVPWLKIVEEAPATAQVKAKIPAMRACARSAGVDTSRIHSVFDLAGAGDGPQMRARTVQEADAADRKSTAIFIRCARPVVDVQERLLSAEKKVFLKEHAQQVAELQRVIVPTLIAARVRLGLPPSRWL